ncbi:glycosyltransferase family 32 protein [Myroides fluvii]|uniref:glycosyltransferase family 32 protein n=1 Tax=Myroides fluvii TaxID=2572594 RepID=UPI00131DEEA1|nr:glycosyltransferase [Myroides fluvii]
MIPKKIHLCWFGRGAYPEEMQLCLKSIEQYLPQYEVIIWTEDNFDIASYRFAQEAYQEKKYAFVSDVCRLHALNEQGGIYFDTDIEIVQNFDAFLAHQFFCGFESDRLLSTAVLGSEKNNLMLQKLLDAYRNKSFYRKHLYKKYYTTPNTITITQEFLLRGLQLTNQKQELEGGKYVIYPQAFFSPKDWNTGVYTITPDTHAIHHFSGSWMGGENRKDWIKRLFFSK